MENFIKQVIWRRDFGFEEDSEDLETLREVQKLLSANKEPDTLFKVQGVKIAVHKSILSLRSSFFAKMFSCKGSWMFSC